MLIISERQTDNDLLFYKQYDKYDCIKKISSEKINITNKIITDYFSKNKCYCLVSWGKDSVVLAYLCSKLKLKIPIIWIKEEPMYNPDCLLVRDIFLKKYDVFSYHEFNCDYGKIKYSEFCDKNGNPSLFYDMCELLKKNFGSRITGIRNEESNKRLLRFRKYGFSTENTCAPLSLWSISEIFSFIYHFELPLNPAYGCIIGGKYDRNNIRTDIIGGFEGDGMGRILWEKTYYSDVLNKMNIR